MKIECWGKKKRDFDLEVILGKSGDFNVDVRNRTCTIHNTDIDTNNKVHVCHIRKQRIFSVCNCVMCDDDTVQLHV